MRHLTLTVAAIALMASASPSLAQRWTSINERQARLDDRIDAGLRTGDLTRPEAKRLRDAFRDIARLESRYRADGLTAAERRALDRRFDRLSAQIRTERHDTQIARGWFGGEGWRDSRGAWMTINQRQRELDRRIDTGLRVGTLSRAEARQLRADFRAIARLEARYRRDGLDLGERADLDRRFDGLSARIRWENSDSQLGYGYGRRR